MEAREIRVGNYVMHEGKLIQFDESNWYRIGDCIEFLEEFEPIPLTEEWFEKFGFIYGDEDGIITFCKDDLYFEQRYGHFFGGEYYVLCNLINCPNTPTVESVHQLQNLYFALTGKELEEK